MSDDNVIIPGQWPNPHFLDPLPKHRCGTCRQWERVSGRGIVPSFMHKGVCHLNSHLVYPETGQGHPVVAMFHTTDLQVCSGWEEDLDG